MKKDIKKKINLTRLNDSDLEKVKGGGGDPNSCLTPNPSAHD